MRSPDDDYATPQRLAIYLEIGWSDYLFGSHNDAKPDPEMQYPNPLRDHVAPNFPAAAAKLAKQWTQRINSKVESYCDVGGATGRAIFEFERQFPDLDRLVLVEPSKRFCEWARRLLSSDDELPEIPLADRIGSPQWVAAKSKPPLMPRAGERLTIINGSLENYRPQDRFDLVTCFNVVDRHPCPRKLVEHLGGLLNNNGLLLLSSPFDFREQSTPNVDCWIDDLNVLFTETETWGDVGEDELYYEYRPYNRGWTRFIAQVVAKRWHA